MFKLATRAANFSRFKGQISVGLFLNVVHKVSCGRCDGTHDNETCYVLKVKVVHHSGVSFSTEKKDHRMPVWKHMVSFEDFEILSITTSDFYSKARRSLLI